MTLPSSGALSINDIKGEFGGPTSPSLSDYYAGGTYVPAGTTGTNGAVPSSGAISISNFYGTSNYIDTQTVTVGTTSDKLGTYWGYSTGGVEGSISDGTFNPLGGAAITVLDWSTLDSVQFYVSGTFSNTGWAEMIIDGTSFTRASATYSTSSGITYWSWSGVTTNPFGTTVGATKVVNFR